MRNLVFSWIVLVLLVPILVLANLDAYFYWSFERYGVYQSFITYSHKEVQTNFQQVISQLKPPFTAEMDPDFFSREDRWHMQDVRTIMVFIYAAAVGLLIANIYLTHKLKTAKRQRLISLFTNYLSWVMVSLVGIGIIMALSWNQVFVLFHRILFPFNNYWSLDPATSNLIKYFPNSIFQELALLYFVGVCIIYICTIKFINRGPK